MSNEIHEGTFIVSLLAQLSKIGVKRLQVIGTTLDKTIGEMHPFISEEAAKQDYKLGFDLYTDPITETVEFVRDGISVAINYGFASFSMMRDLNMHILISPERADAVISTLGGRPDFYDVVAQRFIKKYPQKLFYN